MIRLSTITTTSTTGATRRARLCSRSTGSRWPPRVGVPAIGSRSPNSRAACDIAATLPSVVIRPGWRATDLRQDEHGVVLTGSVTSQTGGSTMIRAQYVVGADGANSFVRTMLGLDFTDHGFFFDWLILDMIPHASVDHGPTHWQLCDPARPTTIVPGGPGRRR